MQAQSTKTTKNLEIILVQHDLGAPSPGAAEGPTTVLEHLFSTLPHVKTDKIQTINPPSKQEDEEKTPHAKNLARTLSTVKSLRDIVTKSLKHESFPLVISGDHSTAIGTMAGIKNAFPALQMGVVWFDAHTDIHSPYTSHSGNLHGMPLSAATVLDNMQYQRQPITVLEKKLWSEIKNLGTTNPLVELENIVFVGIRDMEEEEKSLVESRDCLILDAGYVQNETSTQLMDAIQKHLRHCDVVYISFDIDCLDKSLVPGTGTPVDGGPDAGKVLELVSMLSKWEKVVCFELSEINPRLDKTGKTVQTATKVVCNALSFLG